MIRPMEEGARPRRRPAAEKLPVSTTTVKISRSPVRSPEKPIYASDAQVFDILLGYTTGCQASTFAQCEVKRTSEAANARRCVPYRSRFGRRLRRRHGTL